MAPKGAVLRWCRIFLDRWVSPRILFLIGHEADRLIDFDHRIKDHAAAFVSDKDFAKREERWPVDTPDTKEAYYIREIFDGE